MISPEYSEIFGICRILPAVSSQKFFNSVNSEVTGLNLTKIVHNAEKFKPFNRLKLELRYCNTFRNGSVIIKDWSAKNADFATNWLPWQCPLSDRNVIYQVNKKVQLSTSSNHSNGIKMHYTFGVVHIV